jgi:hypothetical protein
VTTKPAEVVDFIAVIDALRRHGFGLRSIGAQVGADPSTVHDYHNGAVPRFHVGERLIVLWCGVTNQPREMLPMTRELPSASRVKSW